MNLFALKTTWDVHMYMQIGKLRVTYYTGLLFKNNLASMKKFMQADSLNSNVRA